MTGSIQVLHVDDEPDFADLAATFLEREDDRFSVTTARSASDGLDHLAEAEVDCIVSDYDMPGRNGIEFLETVRETDPDLPFILFTGKGTEAVASDAISAGVTDYLQKEGDTSQYTVLANRIANAVEQYRSQQALSERTRQLETLIRNLPRMVYRCANGRGWPMESVGGEVEQLAGYTAAELQNDDVSWGEEIIHPDDRETVWNSVQTALDEAEPFEITYRIVTRDGTTKWVWEQGRGVFTGDGELEALEGFITGIDAPKKHEHELREERAFVDQALDTLNEVFYVVGTDGQLRRWNAQLSEVTGYTDEEITDAKLVELFPDDERERISEAIDETVATGETSVEADVLTAEGERVPYEFTGARLTDPGGDLIGVVGVGRVVTEDEERERELERKTRAIDEAPIGITISDPSRADNPVIYANEQFTELTGYDNAEVLDRNCRFLQGEGTDSEPVAEIRAAIDDEEPVTVDLRNYRKNGTEFWNRVSIAPVDDEAGEVVNYVGCQQDITEHKRREQALKALHDVATDITTLSDPDAICRRTVEAAESVLDFDKCILYLEEDGQLPVVAVSEEFPGDGVDMMPLEGSRAGKTYRTGISTVFADLDDDPVGKPQESFGSGMSLPIGDHGVMQAVSRTLDAFDEADLELGELLLAHTEQALGRTEQEATLRRQNARLEEFTRVVSHDLRNPLNVAEGNLELAQEECDNEYLDAVAEPLDRMNDLIGDLLALTREGDEVSELEPVDLADRSETCWRNVATADATIEIGIDRTVRADPGRLQQLLENLYRNAVEHADEAVTVTVGERDDGFYVEDDGPGIPPSEREAVFDAGYSTAAHGTGFGLSIVKQVANAHGWDVRVTEGTDGGARFEITGVEFD